MRLFISLLAPCLLFCVPSKAQQKTFKLDSVYTIAIKDTLCLNNGDFCWVFNYHSHKNYADRDGSVLIADFSFVKNNITEKKHFVGEKPSFYWEWDKYAFTILEFEYDKSMLIKTAYIKK